MKINDIRNAKLGCATDILRMVFLRGRFGKAFAGKWEPNRHRLYVLDEFREPFIVQGKDLDFLLIFLLAPA